MFVLYLANTYIFLKERMLLINNTLLNWCKIVKNKKVELDDRITFKKID